MADEIEVPTEPIISAEERAKIVDLVQAQVNATLDAVREGDRLDAADGVEAFLDLGLLVGQILAPPGVSAALTLLAPAVKPLVMAQVESAVAASRVPERLLERATAAEDAADDHVEDALELTNTPEREFFEKLRVNIHLRRASFLRRKALRLRAEALAAEA